MEHPNVTVLHEVLDTWDTRDLAAFLSHCTDDLVAHVGGDNVLTGTYRGLEAYTGYLTKLVELAPDQEVFEVHDVLADDECGVILLRFVARRDGASLDMRMAFAVRFEDHKWKEVWYLPADQKAFDEFMS